MNNAMTEKLESAISDLNSWGTDDETLEYIHKIDRESFGKDDESDAFTLTITKEEWEVFRRLIFRAREGVELYKRISFLSFVIKEAQNELFHGEDKDMPKRMRKALENMGFQFPGKGSRYNISEVKNLFRLITRGVTSEKYEIKSGKKKGKFVHLENRIELLKFPLTRYPPPSRGRTKKGREDNRLRGILDLIFQIYDFPNIQAVRKMLEMEIKELSKKKKGK